MLINARATSNGGFILAGYSNSGPSGNKTSPNYGGYDFWIVRIDQEGNKIWDRSYGGVGEDVDAHVTVARDGGFFVGGGTQSGVGGNKTSPFYGGSYYGDYWILRLDSEGNKLWEQDFGGSRSDVFSDLQEMLDGGVMIAGFSMSENDGNKSAPWLNRWDLWLVRLDQDGGKVWDQTYDGSYHFVWPQFQPISDGGTIIAASVHDNPNDPWPTDLMLMKLSADALTAPELRITRTEPAPRINFIFPALRTHLRDGIFKRFGELAAVLDESAHFGFG